MTESPPLTEDDRRQIHEAAATFITTCFHIQPKFATWSGKMLELLSELDRKQLTDEDRIRLARWTRSAIQQASKFIDDYCEAALPLFATTKGLTEAVALEDDDDTVIAVPRE